MDNGRYFAIRLKPGKYTIRLTDDEKGYTIDASPGQTYFFRIGVEWGMFKGHGTLRPDTRERAVEEIKKLKFLGQDKIKAPALVMEVAPFRWNGFCHDSTDDKILVRISPPLGVLKSRRKQAWRHNRDAFDDEAAAGTARQRSNRMVTGLFRDRESAERAYGSLSERGYGKDDVNLLMSDDTRKKYFSDDDDTEFGTKAWEGAGKGAAIGGGVGTTLGAIAAIGTTLALPGLGLLIAGPIAAALAGGGAGALTGGSIRALVGHGIPEEHAKHYEQGIREGGIVMGVQPRSDRR